MRLALIALLCPLLAGAHCTGVESANVARLAMDAACKAAAGQVDALTEDFEGMPGRLARSVCNGIAEAIVRRITPERIEYCVWADVETLGGPNLTEVCVDTWTDACATLHGEEACN